jgi:hypothetical protein
MVAARSLAARRAAMAASRCAARASAASARSSAATARSCRADRSVQQPAEAPGLPCRARQALPSGRL